MNAEDDVWSGFPPGALVFEAEGEIDSIPFHTRRPTQDPVYVNAQNGWMMIQEIDDFWIEFDVPCGEGSETVLVWWSFEAIEALEQPPGVTTSDPDGDVCSLRLMVDGVLIEESTTTIAFSTAHELTAIVRDDRGATTTVRQVVGCE